MDKQELAQQILSKYKLTGYVPPERRAVDLSSRFAELDAVASGQDTTKNTTDEKYAKLGRTGEKLGSIFGGSKVGEGIGTLIARNKAKTGEMELVDYSSLSPQAIERLRAKGVPVTEEEQRAEIAKGIEGPSAKELAGDVAKIGLNFVGVGAGSKAVQGVKAGATIGQAVKTGAKTGALLGGASGVATGLQEDKSALEIAKSGVIGAGVGGVLGGAVGGATKLVGNAIANRGQKKISKAIENITPKADEINVTEYKKLLAQGKISPKTATSPAQYILSDTEKQTATKYANLINKDPVKTTLSITDEIARQDADVGNFLQKKNAIFNTGELRNKLSSSMDEVVDLTVTDKQLNTAKKKLVESFIKDLPKNDMKTLWELRKSYDKQIEKVFGKTSPTLTDEMKTALRNAVQDFISEKTDDVTYKSAMKEMSSLYRLRDSAITKAGKEKAKNAIQAWVRDNPVKAKALGFIGAGVVADKLGII